MNNKIIFLGYIDRLIKEIKTIEDISKYIIPETQIKLVLYPKEWKRIKIEVSLIDEK